MTLSLTPTFKRESWNNDVKELLIKLATPVAAATYDTNMDATDGKGADFREIFSAVFSAAQQDNTTNGKVNNNAKWSTSTGIITLGTVSPSAAVGYLTIKGQ